jgi:hypothetical protein
MIQCPNGLFNTARGSNPEPKGGNTMKSLRYTNFLLTVIAVCLVYQCVKFEAAPTMAQATYTQGTTASANRPIPVQIFGTPIVKVDGRVRTETVVTGMPSVDIASVSAADPGKTKYGLPVMVINPNNQIRPNQAVDVKQRHDVETDVVGRELEGAHDIKSRSADVGLG